VNHKGVSILFVEDDDIVREIICSFITTKYPTIPTYSAGSAEDGMDLFKKHRQSIIITDINLVESDGIQMVRSIRKLDPCSIIIFMTGFVDAVDISEFDGAGSCHYICKPVNFNDLFALLDSCIHIDV
jgi:DNA-binding response OmpR family regulator